MSNESRLFDVVDILVGRPGMYVQKIGITEVYGKICDYNFALAVSANCDRVDQGESIEFEAFHSPLDYLEEFLTKELSQAAGQFNIPEYFLNHANGSEEQAFNDFRNLYIKFRGKSYKRYAQPKQAAHNNRMQPDAAKLRR